MLPAAEPLVTYTETKDDLGPGIIKTIIIGSPDGRGTCLFLVRKNSDIEIQFATKDTLFPDAADSDRGTMTLSVTQKFDTETDASTTDWSMTLLKYHNAWYQGDAVKFLKACVSAKTFVLKANKHADVYHFSLAGVGAHIPKLIDGLDHTQSEHE